MKKEKEGKFTPRQLLEEARQQKEALAQLGGWQRNAMLASSCGAAGVLLTLAGILCAALIGLGIRNGRRNVERLLKAAESN